ncbi:hypothetical protein BHE74_00031190 [Ensete ventricosum]|uniref:Uncharacterized protein n=1 Tax=Ensete ventricosum TaxID=4639 RepID=A0A427AL14_ENSVE|nr:hypothetical protein B296_00027628 [Ensete ventricosum]RWW61764.1 hypothetical protein BHE74_00031190 [Ensete ventricosum]
MGGRAQMGKRIAEMGFNTSGGVINWFPGHMAAATRAIRDRLRLADLVIEVRDARVISFNNIIIIASDEVLRFLLVLFVVQEKIKHATVGPLPGVTQDIAGYKVLIFSVYA